MQTPTQQPDGSTRAEAQKCITRLRRRFQRWELTHLRELAASLDSQLEEAQARANSAERNAEVWWHHAQDLREALLTTAPSGSVSIGLSQNGALHVLKDGAAQDALDLYGRMVRT